jgi:hypothetical protein
VGWLRTEGSPGEDPEGVRAQRYDQKSHLRRQGKRCTRGAVFTTIEAPQMLTLWLAYNLFRFAGWQLSVLRALVGWELSMLDALAMMLLVRTLRRLKPHQLERLQRRLEDGEI